MPAAGSLAPPHHPLLIGCRCFRCERTGSRPSRHKPLALAAAAGAKQRFSDDRVVISAVIGDIEGKDVIVLDDEIARGSTVIELVHTELSAAIDRLSKWKVTT